MKSTAHPQEVGPREGRPAVFLLDEHGTVRQCTATVYGLLGWSAEELEGRPMADICTAPVPWDDWRGRAGEREFGAVLRHRDGTPVEADVEVVTLPTEAPAPSGGPEPTEAPAPSGGPEPTEGQAPSEGQAPTEAQAPTEGQAPTEPPAGLLVFATPVTGGRRGEQDQGQDEDKDEGRDKDRDQALIHVLFTQDRVGLVMRSPGPSAHRVSLNPDFFGLARPDRPDRPEVRLQDILVTEDAEAIDERLRQVLETGEPLVGWEHSARRHDLPGRERVVSVSAFRLENPPGNVLGVAAVLIDITELHVARRRLDMLDASAHRLGRSLDVTRNAEHVVELLVPAFADQACVDLREPVRRGGDPGSFVPGTPLRRLAVASANGTWPTDLYQRDDQVRVRDVESHALAGGGTVVVPDLAALRRRLEVDPERLRLIFPASATSAMFAPLFARGQVLGVLSMWRGPDRLPFSTNDIQQIEAIASRAALSLDNARRYTRERRTVEELQRSLLPPRVVRTAAADTAGAYAPASSAAGTGGSWYDVIRLSGVRTAFVAGRVAGHGMYAAGTMGRMRSAVRTLADLDLAPDELLSHLTDLVSRAAEDEVHLPGATCLYASYDPITGQCLVATAGHPAPVVARRHTGTVNEVRLQPGPPLGGGSEPFETAQLLLNPGDVLAVHSGLPTDGVPGAAEDLQRLHDSARAAARTDTPLADITDRLLNAVRAKPRAEDLVLLLARVDRVPPDRTVFWQLSADPGQVAQARSMTSAQLAEWDLTDMTFSTELVVSELVTNAIRFAGGPIGLRLIKDRKLIIEVTDPSQSQPHLRRARLSDEGGRGLFLIAQLTDRWGSRYTTEGKTIWTEQVYETEGAAWSDGDGDG